MDQEKQSKASTVIEGLKDAGGAVLGCGLSIGVIVLGILVLVGGMVIAEKVIGIIMIVFNIATAVLILVLAPCAFFKKTRNFSATGIIIASYVFGFTLWIYSALVTYVLWGLLALIIGVLILGVGVFPIAILASIFNAEWMILVNIIYMAFLTYGARILGFWLAEKAEKDSYIENINHTNPISDLDNNYLDDESILDAEIVEDDESSITNKEIKHCQYCGKKINTEANFCKYCGNKLN